MASFAAGTGLHGGDDGEADCKMINAPMLMARRCGRAELLLVGLALVACFDDKEIRFIDSESALSPGGAGGTAGRAGAGGAMPSSQPPAGGAPSAGAASGGAAGALGPVALPAGGVTSLDVDAGAGAGGAGFDAGLP
jgi:hypothetical protein